MSVLATITHKEPVLDLVPRDRPPFLQYNYLQHCLVGLDDGPFLVRYRQGGVSVSVAFCWQMDVRSNRFPTLPDLVLVPFLLVLRLIWETHTAGGRYIMYRLSKSYTKKHKKKEEKVRK
jgi:hypothetical protein